MKKGILSAVGNVLASFGNSFVPTAGTGFKTRDDSHRSKAIKKRAQEKANKRRGRKK